MQHWPDGGGRGSGRGRMAPAVGGLAAEGRIPLSQPAAWDKGEGEGEGRGEGERGGEPPVIGGRERGRG